MTTGRKPTTSGKGGVKKLKLKKETLKDLDAKRKSGDVKGGYVPTAKTFKEEHSCRSCAVC